MSYKIVVDSCCDLSEDMKEWNNFDVVPLTLEIGDYTILDDAGFNQDDFISRMKANGGMAKSACPAPDLFKEAYEGDFDCVYVLTITDKLSGTYNSALQGKMLYEEEHNDGKKIHVFNSLATSGLETIVARLIKKLAKQNKDFDEIVSYVEDYIVNHTGLYFNLESFDALKKNGRLFALAASVFEKIKVKIICKRTTEGNISLAGQDLTTNRALTKISNLIAENVKDKNLDGKSVIITHVCCKEKGEFLAKKIAEKTNYKNIEIIKASGLNSLYASDGGIIVSYDY